MIIKKKIKNKIAKAGIWYLFTNFFTKGLSFLMIPVFTRLLSVSDYGIVNVYKSYVNIVYVIFSLNLVGIVQRAYFDHQNDYKKMLSNIHFLGVLSFLVFSFVVFLFRDFLSEKLQIENILLYTMIVEAFFLFTQRLYIALKRVLYEFKLLSLLTIAISALGMLFSVIFICFVFEEKAYLGRIFGNILPLFLFGIIIMIIIYRKGKEIFNLKIWKYSIFLSLPLIGHSLAGIINAQFDRIILNKYMGATDAGLYSFAYNLGLFITVIWTAMNDAWLPWFFEKMKKKEYSTIKKRSVDFRNIFSLFYIIILYLSPEVVKIMAAKEYWPALEVLPLIFLAYYFQMMYSFHSKIEFFLKKTHFLAIGTVLAAIINIVTNLIFIPKYGIFAAAFTTVISYFCLFIFHLIITNCFLGKALFNFRFHGWSLAFCLISTSVFYLLESFLLLRIVIILLSLVFAYKKLKGVGQK